MYDEGITYSTAPHYHRLIKQALSYAVKKDILVYNVMDKVDAPKREAYIADHYSPQEAQRLLSAVKDDHLYIPVLLDVYYGLRRSEDLLASGL